MIEKIILKKSNVLDKMPTAEQLDYGEIALNYNAAHPFLSFKDSDGDIMTLNDYSDDIAYLYSHKLDAGVLDTINENTDAIKKKLNISDFNTFKADNTNEINALRTDIAQNTDAIATINTSIEQKADKTDLDTKVDKTDIVQNTGQSTTSVMSQKAVSDALSTKVGKTDITQSTGTSETSVMSQKAVSDALSNVSTESEFEYCGLMEWDGTNEVKIYEMKFDSPKREVFIYGACTWDKSNKGQFKIIITNEKYPSGPYGISYFNSSSNAEECFHIHNVCGNYVCDINTSNNHLVPNALTRCYMRNLLTDKNHEDVGLITNLKIEITTDLVRIDGVQKWYVFAKN